MYNTIYYLLNSKHSKEKEALMKYIQSVCVYCGSCMGNNPLYQKIAQDLGKFLGQNNINLIYGGGTKGLMGLLANATQQNGAKVTGIIPEFLMNKEANEKDIKKLDHYIITETMHERKYAMFAHADAVITLPGGIGTLEELVEIITLAQLEQHNKPIILININQFWDPLITLLSHMQKEGFIHSQDKIKLHIIDDIGNLSNILTKAVL